MPARQSPIQTRTLLALDPGLAPDALSNRRQKRHGASPGTGGPLSHGNRHKTSTALEPSEQLAMRKSQGGPTFVEPSWTSGPARTQVVRKNCPASPTHAAEPRETTTYRRLMSLSSAAVGATAPANRNMHQAHARPSPTGDMRTSLGRGGSPVMTDGQADGSRAVYVSRGHEWGL